MSKVCLGLGQVVLDNTNKRNMEEAMPLEPIKPFISDKNLKRAIVISWVGTAVLTTGFLYVIAHFVAKFW